MEPIPIQPNSFPLPPGFPQQRGQRQDQPEARRRRPGKNETADDCEQPSQANDGDCETSPRESDGISNLIDLEG